MRKIFLSPHNDDETLFGAFTMMRENPELVVVYDSYKQPKNGYVGCGKEIRRLETLAAVQAMGLGRMTVKFLGLNDEFVDAQAVNAILKQFADCLVWAPLPEEGGNLHHNLVGNAAGLLFSPSQVVYYTTYTNVGKSVGRIKVAPIDPSHVSKKLEALACYKSQINLPCCRPHFLRDQSEYYA